jgi:pyocin large subunit-like protein
MNILKSTSNTFAIINKDGIMKTMFKPKEGIDYYHNAT